MRELWESEYPLGPGARRIALVALTALLGAFAVVMGLVALGSLVGGHIGAAVVQLLAAALAPLAIWLPARLLNDIAAHQARAVALLDEATAAVRQAAPGAETAATSPPAWAERDAAPPEPARAPTRQAAPAETAEESV